MRGIQIETFDARLGMRPHSRMAGDKVLGFSIGILNAVLAGLGRVGFSGRIYARQRTKHTLQAVGESVVRCDLVREERVAAVRGQLAGDQHCDFGRLLEVERVTVPDAAEVALLVFAFEDLDYLGITFNAGDHGIFDGFPETGAELEKFAWAEVLVAEEDDFVIEQGLADLLSHSIV